VAILVLLATGRGTCRKISCQTARRPLTSSNCAVTPLSTTASPSRSSEPFKAFVVLIAKCQVSELDTVRLNERQKNLARLRDGTSTITSSASPSQYQFDRCPHKTPASTIVEAIQGCNVAPRHRHGLGPAFVPAMVTPTAVLGVRVEGQPERSIVHTEPPSIHFNPIARPSPNRTRQSSVASGSLISRSYRRYQGMMYVLEYR